MIVSDARTQARRLNLLVEGHVQGIGFRYSTCAIAAQFPIAGFVKNLPDGNVEIVVEGDENEIGNFLTALRLHRIYRYVTREHIAWSPPRGDFRDFSISYF